MASLELPQELVDALNRAQAALDQANQQAQEARDAAASADLAQSKAATETREANDALVASNEEAGRAIDALKKYFGVA
jgi:hypothetical protein